MKASEKLLVQEKKSLAKNGIEHFIEVLVRKCDVLYKKLRKSVEKLFKGNKGHPARVNNSPTINKKVLIMISIYFVSFLSIESISRLDFSSSDKVFENRVQWGMSAEDIENLEPTTAAPTSTKNEKVYEGALVEGIYFGEGLTTYMLKEDKLYQVNVAVFTDDGIYKDVANTLDRKFTRIYGEGHYSLSDRNWYTEKTKITVLLLNYTFIIIYKDITIQ